jgi:hypothetical protein
MLNPSSSSIILTSIIILIINQIPYVLAQVPEINLMGQEYKWEPFGAAKISQNDTGLNISVKTDFRDELWSRAYLTTQINSTTNRSMILDIGYASSTSEGSISEYGSTASLAKAKFQAEFRDRNSDKILWSAALNNTNGQQVNQKFTLPGNIINQPVEFRLYIMTNGPGQHVLDVSKATLTASVPEPNLTASVPEPNLTASVPEPNLTASVPEPNLTASVSPNGNSDLVNLNIGVKQNPISPGEQQTVTLIASDPITGEPLDPIFVRLTIKDPSGNVIKDYTDNDGNLSPTFIIGENDIGTFMILGSALQAGVESSKSLTFEVQ